MVPKRPRRNSQLDVYLVCAAIMGAFCLLFWVLVSKELARIVPATGRTPASNGGETAPVRPAAIRKPLRALYPHSVIRGGAYSVAELEAALRVDPVAAAHYAVFDRSQMRLTRASDSPAVYVSYRQGDRVYWTRRKMHLAAEEWLLTDGVHAARSRCGNRISLTPQEPTRASEPSAMDLDLPETWRTADEGASVAEPVDLFALHMMVVHEIFPAPIGNWLPAGGPGDASGGSAGTPISTLAPGGQQFLGSSQEVPPLIAGLTFPPPTDFWPLDFHPPPSQPVGPGFVGIPAIPLPGGFGAGSTPGAPPAGTVPPAPGVSDLISIPGIPGGLPFPRPPGENVLFLPPGVTLPPALPAGVPPSQVQLQPNGPLPFAAEIPEPATAALLLCGALLLAFRRRSGRTLD